MQKCQTLESIIAKENAVAPSKPNQILVNLQLIVLRLHQNEVIVRENILSAFVNLFLNYQQKELPTNCQGKKAKCMYQLLEIQVSSSKTMYF